MSSQGCSNPSIRTVTNNLLKTRMFALCRTKYVICAFLIRDIGCMNIVPACERVLFGYKSATKSLLSNIDTPSDIIVYSLVEH